MSEPITDARTILITGSRKGIGRCLAEHYLGRGYQVIGCSRQPSTLENPHYRHYCLDVSDETKALEMFADIREKTGRLNILINNAGVASMNHSLVTPLSTVRSVLETNVVGSFLFCREAAKLMIPGRCGRIVNFATVATPLQVEGEAIYAASKAAVISLTQILARELARFNITVNAVGPAPLRTDLIRGVPEEKLDQLIARQAIRRWAEFTDVVNVIDFFIQPRSSFVTGQTIFLGGVS